MDRRQFLASPLLVSASLTAHGEDNFTPLFDGKTLQGWRIQEGPEGAFYVRDGCIVGHVTSDFPVWLRSDRQYENFDFRCDFFIEGWIDGGIYLHAPEHGRNTWTGMQIKIFHERDAEPRNNSMGAVFPLIAPRTVNVKKGWNSMRILMDAPRLQVWVNEEMVQDVDVEAVPELKWRLRRGYLGLSALGYPIRFRNLRVRELPGKQQWEPLYETDGDFDKWYISESSPRNPVRFETLNGILHGDGAGHIATKEQYRDFEMHLYIRGPKHHNGGVLFHSSGQGLSGKRHYEIQVHDVEDAHYPTGSLYYFKRAIYPRIEELQWYLMQIVVKGKHCMVRVNGETVMEYDQLEDLDAGHIELQAHEPGKWLQYKHIRIRSL